MRLVVPFTNEVELLLMQQKAKKGAPGQRMFFFLARICVAVDFFVWWQKIQVVWWWKVHWETRWWQLKYFWNFHPDPWGR